MGYEIKGLYVITDKRFIARDKFLETVEKAIRGGANIVQLREKDTPKRELIGLGKGLLDVTKKHGVPLIINDLASVAKEIGAQGVHLGQYDTSVREAREILGNGAIIGVSCYNSIERGFKAVKDGADYLAFGTPFFTPTKPDRGPTDYDVLKEATRVFGKIPVFAIGGISIENAPSVLETGVDGIAVITSVFASEDPEIASHEFSSFFKNQN